MRLNIGKRFFWLIRHTNRPSAPELPSGDGAGALWTARQQRALHHVQLWLNDLPGQRVSCRDGLRRQRCRRPAPHARLQAALAIRAIAAGRAKRGGDGGHCPLHWADGKLRSLSSRAAFLTSHAVSLTLTREWRRSFRCTT